MICWSSYHYNIWNQHNGQQGVITKLGRPRLKSLLSHRWPHSSGDISTESHLSALLLGQNKQENPMCQCASWCLVIWHWSTCSMGSPQCPTYSPPCQPLWSHEISVPTSWISQDPRLWNPRWWCPNELVRRGCERPQDSDKFGCYCLTTTTHRRGTASPDAQTAGCTGRVVHGSPRPRNSPPHWPAAAPQKPGPHCSGCGGTACRRCGSLGIAGVGRTACQLVMGAWSQT